MYSKKVLNRLSLKIKLTDRKEKEKNKMKTIEQINKQDILEAFGQIEIDALYDNDFESFERVNDLFDKTEFLTLSLILNERINNE